MMLTFRFYHGILIALLLPSLILAQAGQIIPLKVITPDELLRSMGLQISSNEINGRVQSLLRELERRFLQSRGMEIVQYVEKDTGINLITLVKNILVVSVYIFTQIFAIIADIANKLGAY